MSTTETSLPRQPRAATDVSPPHGRTGLALVLLGVLSSAVVYVLAVLTEPGQRVDNAIMDGAAVPPESRPQWEAWLLDPYLLLGACGVLALLGLIRSPRTALSVVVSVSVLTAATQVLKPLLPRPTLADPWLMTNSLPSGHTAAAAAIAVAVILVLPRILVPLGAMIGMAVTAYMGVMVVLLGFHRPSDVLTSVLLAVAALGFGLMIRGPVRRPHARW